MANLIEAICGKDKLQTIKDIYLETNGKLIKSGTIFYACSKDMRYVLPLVISGLGHSLTIGIRVTTDNPNDPSIKIWPVSSLFLPLDCLQLAK